MSQGGGKGSQKAGGRDLVGPGWYSRSSQKAVEGRVWFKQRMGGAKDVRGRTYFPNSGHIFLQKKVDKMEVTPQVGSLPMIEETEY